MMMKYPRSAHIWRDLNAGVMFLFTVCATMIAFCWGAFFSAAPARGEDRTVAVASRFHSEIRPILARYCYDCHANGEREGQVTLDEFADGISIADHSFWLTVLRAVRAGIMPPAGEERVSADDIAKLTDWIQRDVFAIDPGDPDPGRVTLRRLNRNEYRRTIRDLMGIDYRADKTFPPDDSGHGFDNLGDVLSTSPLLVEKYLNAATEVVHAAVPGANKVVREEVIPGLAFIDTASGDVSCNKPDRYSQKIRIDQAGSYTVSVEYAVYGRIIYDLGGQAEISFDVDDNRMHSQTHSWQPKERPLPTLLTFQLQWQRGEHEVAFEVEPIVTASDGEKPKPTHLMFSVSRVRIIGPSDEADWVTPSNYQQHFPRPEPPRGKAERREYARAVLRPFVDRAFRRPVDEPKLERLVAIAESTYAYANSTFEQGIQQAMIAALSSHRFLFRMEQRDASQPDRQFALLDEYSLASRLSYLLWSSMPDQELYSLARQNKLRNNLQVQVQRMLADPKADAFIESFAGQWLRTREVDLVEIDPRLVLARDLGVESEELGYREATLKRFLEEYKRAEERARRSSVIDDEEPQPVPAVELSVMPPTIPPINFDQPLRSAMRAETELCVDYVFRNDRSILELIDSNYSFLNERLAEHYGVEGVKGAEMRLVNLPEDSPRGGILAHAGILAITSQSTRTSAVKRGLFVLENLLGTPSPPAPPNLPSLEDAEDAFEWREPALREVLESHRRNPVCSSCHSRMDPIGFSLENFNALGMWRTKERGQDLDVEGQLATGEKLVGVADLRRVISNERRLDFYRCVTEKLMIYALGRGLEYYDTYAVDLIVERLESNGGNSFSLLMGVIESAPFQKSRVTAVDPFAQSATSKTTTDEE
jgi:hypothetical protein